MLHFGTSLIRTTIRGAIRVAALLLIVAGAAGGQEPEEQPPLERPPVQLPPSTTVAEARRAASPHSYWRGVNATTGCARGLTLHECASVERAITRLLRHEEPFCRAMGERVRERIAQGRVVVPAVDGPIMGPRVQRGDIVLPANWVNRPTLVLLLVAQVSEEGMDAAERCDGDPASS